MSNSASMSIAASAIVANALGAKPLLVIDKANPHVTLEHMRDILAQHGTLIFDRGVPVRLARDQISGTLIAQTMTPEAVVHELHKVCRPVVMKGSPAGLVEVDVGVPPALAAMYLDWFGSWNLRPLRGFATAPLVHEGGVTLIEKGYDPASRMWCDDLPNMSGAVPEHPMKADAEAALLRLRKAFETFPFADAPMKPNDKSVQVVDHEQPIGKDESAFLIGLMTAVCRPSLPISPGMMVRAAPLSGAGSGKGLLVRLVGIIAYGREPHAVTAGSSLAELDKRLASELMEGAPMVFLDNVNNRLDFRSDLLASAMTEASAKVRLLCTPKMVPLSNSSLVVITGNGLALAEDLTRRFIHIELDARTEDPEARAFEGDIKQEMLTRRPELLGDLLTIFVWGRQAAARGDLPRGRPMGFAKWEAWVRDPLLALGCKDPAERISELKANDSEREDVSALHQLWSRCHPDAPVLFADLHPDICLLLDPQKRGAKHLLAALRKRLGSRMGGYMLAEQKAAGKWGKASYALQRYSDEQRF